MALIKSTTAYYLDKFQVQLEKKYFIYNSCLLSSCPNIPYTESCQEEN